MFASHAIALRVVLVKQRLSIRTKVKNNNPLHIIVLLPKGPEIE